MILGLSYENVRQGSRTFEFKRENHISGRNGVGKTTICDALSFVFTGCDSTGKPAPTHLIQEGKDKMVVRVNTGKAVIERSLTQKKTSTIKLSQNGQPTISLVQNELATMLCSKDCFLAASVAGWFMRQSIETKSKILSEIVPAVDKRKVLEDLISAPIPEYLEGAMTFTKKTDLILQRVAQIRLDVQRKADRLSGEILQLEKVQKPEPPTPLPESPESLLVRRSAWSSYKKDVAAWNTLATRKQLAEHELKQYEISINELKAQIESIQIPEEVHVENVDHLIDELTKQMPVLPPKPEVMVLPSLDVCWTCGQTVGMKHRESVTARNEQLINEWKEQTRVASEKIVELTAKIDQIKAEKGSTFEAYLRAQNARNAVIRQKNSLELKLAGMRPPVIPELPPEPEKPYFDEVTEDGLQAKISEYNRALGHNQMVESMKKKWQQAQKEIEVKHRDLDEIAKTVGFICSVEEGLKRLDDAVFQINKPHFSLRDGYRLVISDEDISVEDGGGKSYTFMSTGEKIRADAYICEKIANSLPRKVKYIFIDNKDLVSGDLSLDVEQVFFTTVTEGDLYVESKN